MIIREIRREKGFTQRQLSDATGIDQASISRMENGKQSITVDYLQRIARAMKVPVESLVRSEADRAA